MDPRPLTEKELEDWERWSKRCIAWQGSDVARLLGTIRSLKQPFKSTVNVAPIFWVSGPPASGKSTLCAALVERFEMGVVIPVDDMREWVVKGVAGPVPWTDETERQFKIAEEAACGVALHYSAAGFAVVIDHCRSMARLETVILENMGGASVKRVCLMPSLEENLRRSRARTNKPFDHTFLEDVIRYTNENYRKDVPEGWMVIDNTCMSVEETLDTVLGRGVQG